MKDEAKKLLYFIINLCFAMYFIILAAERLNSVIAHIINGVALFSTRYISIVNLAIMASVVGAAMCLFVFRNEISFLPSGAEKSNYKVLCAASGILLISGMVHTDNTVTAAQFIAYGILIAAIILRAVILHLEGSEPIILWLSVAYLVAYSMAIPVVYESAMENASTFHIVEGVSMLCMVISFSCLLTALFCGKDNLFYIPNILAAIAFDVATIAMRWSESKNYFVLVFLIITTFMFLFGRTLMELRKHRGQIMFGS